MGVSNDIIAEERGEHWKITPSRCKMMATGCARLMPEGPSNPWAQVFLGAALCFAKPIRTELQMLLEEDDSEDGQLEEKLLAGA